LSGASLRDEQVVRNFADAIRETTKQVMQKLADEGIASGNY
jgi:hypothetical protein